MFDRRLIQNFDWVLLLLIVLIGTTSVLNLYSATYPVKATGGSQIFIKQIYWFLFGLVVLLLMTPLDYHVLERLAYPVYVISLILLVLVLIIGDVRSGSQRW
ncbi:MAG: FtsW/RodA/SpoVE family cell cycle protein, partial [Deltaproteobacteria bacterium]|nr:FtsW/RodA/SpoVE family cell cycle protein [Deltaproteobacteria bacterium]